MDNKSKVAFANTLRGIAALSVLVCHYYGVFWANPTAVGGLINAAPSTLPAPAYLKWAAPTEYFNAGAYGVALFFLISGFVIPFSLRSLGPLRFGINRILRIYPTYFVGFSITLLAIWLSGRYFGKPWPLNVSQIAAHYFPGMRDVLLVRSIDGVIWTLDIEMKFYVACAIAAVWLKRRDIKAFWIPAAIFASAMLMRQWLTVYSGWAVPSSDYQHGVVFVLSSQFLVFMFIGVAFHFLYMKMLRLPKAIALIAALFAMFTTMIFRGIDSYGHLVYLNYVYALATFSIAFAYPRFFEGNRVLDFLANVSYPLYVLHGVAGYVAMRILLDLGLKPKVVLPVATVSALLLAWCVHRLVEQPSQTLAKAIGKRSSPALAVSVNADN